MNDRITIKFYKQQPSTTLRLYKFITFILLVISIILASIIVINEYDLTFNKAPLNNPVKIEYKKPTYHFNESMHLGRSYPSDSFEKMLSIHEMDTLFRNDDSAALDSSNSEILFHQVETAQTLYSLAAKHGVSVESIKKENGLISNIVITGQQLKIRKRKSAKGYYGIDVSEWQSTINWNLVHNDTLNNLKFYIVKATQGIGRVDENYKYNWVNAKKGNANVGAYHFYIFKDDPAKQAANYIRNVKLKQGDLLPIIDVEFNCGSCTTLGVSDSLFKCNLTKFLTLIEAHYKCKPIIYSSLFFYNQYLKNEFKSYPIWIAKYSVVPPTGLFTVETDSSDTDVKIWQFSCHERIKGITGNTDANFIPLQKYNTIIFNAK